MEGINLENMMKNTLLYSVILPIVVIVPLMVLKFSIQDKHTGKDVETIETMMKRDVRDMNKLVIEYKLINNEYPETMNYKTRENVNIKYNRERCGNNELYKIEATSPLSNMKSTIDRCVAERIITEYKDSSIGNIWLDIKDYITLSRPYNDIFGMRVIEQ